MKKALLLALSAVLVLTALTGCGGRKKSKPSSASAATADAASMTSDEVEVFTIKTDYADLSYPKYWEDAVKVQTDKQTVRFTADGGKVTLFTLLFDAADGSVLGTFTSDGKQHTLSMQEGEVDSKSPNADTYYQMQDDVNVLLACLQKDYGFVYNMQSTTAAPSVDSEQEKEDNVFEIKTKVVSLYYPQKWQSKVTVDVTDSKAAFSCGKQQLFDIVFGGSKGDLLGVYQDTEVYIVPYELSSDDEELMEMQEDVNIILHHLMADDLFTAAAVKPT